MFQWGLWKTVFNKIEIPLFMGKKLKRESLPLFRSGQEAFGRPWMQAGYQLAGRHEKGTPEQGQGTASCCRTGSTFSNSMTFLVLPNDGTPLPYQVKQANTMNVGDKAEYLLSNPSRTLIYCLVRKWIVFENVKWTGFKIISTSKRWPRKQTNIPKILPRGKVWHQYRNELSRKP